MLTLSNSLQAMLFIFIITPKVPNAFHGNQTQHCKVEVEKVCNRVFFKANFAVPWTQKEFVEPNS